MKTTKPTVTKTREAGKGSKPRPLTVPYKTYLKNYDLIDWTNVRKPRREQND